MKKICGRKTDISTFSHNSHVLGIINTSDYGKYKILKKLGIVFVQDDVLNASLIIYQLNVIACEQIHYY